MIDEQLALFGQPIVRVSHEGTISERFERFHSANPHIAESLTHLALQERAIGATRISMKYLFEVLRWKRRQSIQTDEPYKINNDFTPLYARLIADRDPRLAGLFEKRVRRAA